MGAQPFPQQGSYPGSDGGVGQLSRLGGREGRSRQYFLYGHWSLLGNQGMKALVVR